MCLSLVRFDFAVVANQLALRNFVTGEVWKRAEMAFAFFEWFSCHKPVLWPYILLEFQLFVDGVGGRLMLDILCTNQKPRTAMVNEG